jgi:hypothetical protein
VLINLITNPSMPVLLRLILLSCSCARDVHQQRRPREHSNVILYAKPSCFSSFSAASAVMLQLSL